MGFDTTWRIIYLKLINENSKNLNTLKDFFSAINLLNDKAKIVRPIDLCGRNDLGFWLGFLDWKYSSKIHS